MSTRKRLVPDQVCNLEELLNQEEVVTEDIKEEEIIAVIEEVAPVVKEEVKPEVKPEPVKLLEKPKPKQPEVTPKPVTPHVNPKPNTSIGASTLQRNIPRFLR